MTRSGASIDPAAVYRECLVSAGLRPVHFGGGELVQAGGWRRRVDWATEP